MRQLLIIAMTAIAGCWMIAPAQAKDRPSPDLRLTFSGDGPLTRNFILPVNKSVIVDLPVRAGDVIVANPDIVDVAVRSQQRLFLFAREVGQTNAFLFDTAGQRIGSLDIRVEPDLAGLEDSLARHLPSARIKAEAINESIILTGSVTSAADSHFAKTVAEKFTGDADNVLNRLSIEGQEQVLLQVRVLEMQRTVLKQLGVDLAAAIGSGNVIFDVATVNPFSLTGQALGGLGTGAVTGATALWADGGDAVATALRAFERDGVARTLAEPNLTAISGEPASFLAGGEFPVPTSRDRDGNVTVTFKPFGVGLGFTPVVLSEGRISLRISTEVSELSSTGAFLIGDIGGGGGTTIPALSVRRAETTVELPSGGSLVIAGLIQESLKQNIDGVPGLKSIPILGSLFRSRDFQNAETELIVIVTPYLVDAVPTASLATPGDGFIPASDLDTFLRGRLNRVYGEKAKTVLEQFNRGSIGFILE